MRDVHRDDGDDDLAPVLDPPDPYDLNPIGMTIRPGKELKKKLEQAGKPLGYRLPRVVNQLLKKGLRREWPVVPKDPLDRKPENASIRLGEKLKADLEELAEKNGLTISELINQWLKLGLQKDAEDE